MLLSAAVAGAWERASEFRGQQVQALGGDHVPSICEEPSGGNVACMERIRSKEVTDQDCGKGREAGQRV